MSLPMAWSRDHPNVRSAAAFQSVILPWTSMAMKASLEFSRTTRVLRCSCMTCWSKGRTRTSSAAVPAVTSATSKMPSMRICARTGSNSVCTSDFTTKPSPYRATGA